MIRHCEDRERALRAWRDEAIQPSAGNSTGFAGGTFAGSARGTVLRAWIATPPSGGSR